MSLQWLVFYANSKIKIHKIWCQEPKGWVLKNFKKKNTSPVDVSAQKDFVTRRQVFKVIQEFK